MELYFFTLIQIITLSGITIVANLAEQKRELRPFLYFSILALIGILLLFPISILLTPDESFSVVSIIITLALTGASISACLSFLTYQGRVWVAHFFPKAHTEKLPLNIIYNSALYIDFPNWFNNKPSSNFRPNSMVHMWALILVILFLASQLISVTLAGGVEGIAEDIGVDYDTLILNFLPQVIIPVLGVGLFIRRDWQTTLQRLGLGPISLKGLAVSVATTIGLFIMVVFVVGIWIAIVGEETYEKQSEASEALSQSINTIGLAFLLALTAGVGEEIAFRGALQPVFGFWFTAIVFTLAHTQYTLTPATLIIFLVALAFGLIRTYFNTTTAILTHFLYNFIPLLLSLTVPEETIGLIF